MIKLKIDEELRDLFPPLTAEEYFKLEESILKNGLQDKIKIWDGYIIDGHNRYSICKKHNITISKNDVVELKLQTKQQAIEWMLSYQLGRRNLSEVKRYEIVQKYKDYFIAKAKENNSNGGKGLSTLTKVNTRKEMAKMARVSEGTYHKLDKIKKSGNEELKKKVKNEEVSINKAYKEIIEPIKPKTETTDDVDNKLLKLDEEIEKIKKEKEKMYLRRQEVFDNAPDNVYCEIEFNKNGGTFKDSLYANFYLIKGKNKIKVIDNFYCETKKSEIIEDIELNLSFHHIIKYRLTQKEKNIVISKWYDMQSEINKILEEVEEEKHKKNQEFADKVCGFAQTKINISKDYDSLYKEYINAGYTRLATKYHPDNGGDAEKFKEVVDIKKGLLKFFNSFCSVKTMKEND